MSESTWEVKHPSFSPVHVTADTWKVNDNGDLIFGNETETTFQGVRMPKFFPTRAFSFGRWEEVFLYA